MRIGVTGASGFIGKHVCQQAREAGHETLALPLSGVIAPGLDALIHLVAAGVNDPSLEWGELFRVNVEQSLNLWLRAADSGIRRFVICGSCFEYGLSAIQYDRVPVTARLIPLTRYAASKAAATMAALAFSEERSVQVIVARPFQVFGPGEKEPRLWPSLKRAALRGDDFPMTLGEQVRDFIPVEWVARFLLSLAVPPGFRGVVNIGTGEGRTVLDFAGEWWRRWGAKGKLLPGSLPYRRNELMRCVAEL